MSSVTEMPRYQRVIFARHFYGYRLSLSEALAMAGLSRLDENAHLFVRPNIPQGVEIADNGDIVVRKHWMRRVR